MKEQKEPYLENESEISGWFSQLSDVLLIFLDVQDLVQHTQGLRTITLHYYVIFFFCMQV